MVEVIGILGVDYTVQEVACISKDTFLYGEIDFVNQIIKIDKSLTSNKKEQTLLHEILHAILEELGLQEINQNEEAVQSISAVLYHLLKTQSIFS